MNMKIEFFIPAHREHRAEMLFSVYSVISVVFYTTLLDAEQTCQVTGIDLAKERHSKAMVVVEVKKQGDDMDSAVSQGLSYVEWLFKYRERLKPGINPF
ncbi:MAG: hypothetical protein KKG76_05490 [Euryarchaeota archaeon]|nr:hypothetical protein [Euryarchaeota archaeon]MBU4139784.1 hypothetical protein [Euryarchaeota archaeon]